MPAESNREPPSTNRSYLGMLGLRTVVYHVGDLESAKNWYAQVLGLTPYVDTAEYVGFNVGGFELGLHPSDSTAPDQGKSVPYWAVIDVELELDRLCELGATPRTAVQDVGGGIKVADVLDPFGNILGIIHNPSFPNTV